MDSARPSTTTGPETPPARRGAVALRLPARVLVAPVLVAVALIAATLVSMACAGEPTAPPTTAAAKEVDPTAAHVELAPGEPVEVDLDGDETPETVLLDPGDFTIFIEDGSITYRSRDRWKVVQAAFGDLDSDGLPEVVALLDSEIGRHIGLFAYFGGKYRERLVSQAIDPAPLRMRVIGDGTQAGEVLELQQPSPVPDDAPHVILLRWNGFGFTRIE